MKNTLFLYMDILGFKDMIKNKSKIKRLYKILDSAFIHKDRNFRTIVFSDTLLAFNIYDDLKNDKKKIELMYLIELTQNIFNKFIGENIYFRAIITEGEFIFENLEHFHAYYGNALIDTHKNEKELKGIGLYLDKKLRIYNRFFRYFDIPGLYDFIYLTNNCCRLFPYEKKLVKNNYIDDKGIYPLPEILISSTSAEYLLYPEFKHFKDIFDQIKKQRNIEIRKKYIYTWELYKLAYPALIETLCKSKFNPKSVCKINWSKAKKLYNENKTDILAYDV
ncbi:hypothetical protein [Leptospira sp. GIMC2001]|uniref:hypothetical protein n=1 Tax=Leptospira sp. GIMC2001 TaxID=1513297 RepID=UPI00234AB4A8|nr:hypothetical protein [Leptospira sp. GIMC2001]WCL50791.1 hypothetical protein O4O04_08255 [Leptospira sp. GIMC2001]